MRDSQCPVENPHLAEVVDIRSPRLAATVSSRLRGLERVVPYSVSELVAIQLGEAGDPWRLSLVQRDSVWESTQVRYLLDSLLFGYPIGSMLLCTVKQGGSVLEKEGAQRVRREASEEVFQLLDGQQRMNALTEIFAAQEDATWRYLLLLDGKRKFDDVARRRRSLDRSLGYIQATNGQSNIDERWRWLDVGRLHEAAKGWGHSKTESPGTMDSSELVRLASEIDPECKIEGGLKASDLEKAGERLRRLLDAWYARSVPVVKLELESPTDVLQVFNRVNRTGTAVAGDDIFFAAVRTLWPDAEEHVERVAQHTAAGDERPRLLSRIDALRVLARVASHEEKMGDLFPLDVERLREEPGKRLTDRMEKRSETDSRFLQCVQSISRKAIEDSGLGHALHVIPKRLLDPVFAWAWARKPDRLGKADLKPAWAFLLGAQAFRYISIFGATFERLAFEMAVKAGERGEAFPVEDIVAECRVRWPGLRQGRRRVASLGNGRDARAKACMRGLVHDNGELFLRIVQDVPFELPEDFNLQIEHLYPQDLVKNLTWKGKHDEFPRRRRHDEAYGIWRTGNLCMLKGSLNQAAGKDWPDEKLEFYEQHLEVEKDLFLSAREQALLADACRKLRQTEFEDAVRVPNGIAPFKKYVQARELRIFRKIRSRFPRALSFAAPGNETE
jgi:hypothetical protein